MVGRVGQKVVVVFYISGHGFGHATRDIEVLNAIGARVPDARLVVRTTAARWLLDLTTRTPIDIHPVATDVGVVQIDSLRLDEEATAREAAAFYRTFETRVDDEATYLRQCGATIVLGDIPPLAFAAADRAGVRSIAIGNFTWDWIYRAYEAFDRVAPDVIPMIRDAYRRTTLALRLPMHGGFEPMAGVVHDMPFIARRSRRDPHDTRRALGITSDRPVVLASFGGYGLRLPYAEIVRPGQMTVLVTDRDLCESDLPPTSRGRFMRVDVGGLYASGIRYEDLVAAADVVVTKPGYGIVSDCIANDTALLYTSRGRFPEHDVFVAEMPRVLRCRYLSQDDLLAGRWTAAVQALLEQPPPADRPRVDGAEVVASAVVEQ